LQELTQLRGGGEHDLRGGAAPWLPPGYVPVGGVGFSQFILVG